jgi:hypothetical protein
MFSMIGNLAKAAVAVALTPVALMVDVVTLPLSAMDLHAGPFDRTKVLLNSTGENVHKAIGQTK